MSTKPMTEKEIQDYVELNSFCAANMQYAFPESELEAFNEDLLQRVINAEPCRETIEETVQAECECIMAGL